MYVKKIEATKRGLRLGFLLHIHLDASYSNSYVNKESGAK
jgi:hypothetical protein